MEVLSDHFGQFDLILKCEACGHERKTTPHALAKLCGGWDARLADVVKRMRCSKCQQKRCRARVLAPSPPRGYKSH